MVTDGLGWTRRGAVTTRVRLHCESCSELLRAAQSCSDPGGGGGGGFLPQVLVPTVNRTQKAVVVTSRDSRAVTSLYP